MNFFFMFLLFIVFHFLFRNCKFRPDNAKTGRILKVSPVQGSYNSVQDSICLTCQTSQTDLSDQS